MDGVVFAGWSASARVARTRRVWRRPLRRLLIAAGVMLFAVAALNAWVMSRGGTYIDDVSQVPHAQVALVPGALIDPDGTMSGMLGDRVSQAVALWQAGKVDRILVSGDHSTWDYDEPGTMRDALLARGVPPEAIFMDHAGFDTWASMVRAREIFGVESMIVVTQQFHMSRALFLADRAGVEATGLTADISDYGVQQLRSDAREVGSRVKAVFDTLSGREVMGGPPISLEGDSRVSWGPLPPAGTDVRGAPTRLAIEAQAAPARVAGTSRSRGR